MEMQEKLLTPEGEPTTETLHTAPVPIEDPTSINSEQQKIEKEHPILNKRIIFHTIVTLFSLALFLFHLGSILNRIVLSVRGSASPLYLGLTYTGDIIGMFLGIFGMCSLIFFRVPRAKYYLLIVFLLGMFGFAIYMLVLGVLGYVFFAELTNTSPWIITTVTSMCIFYFLLIWYSFNLCWHTLVVDLPKGHITHGMETIMADDNFIPDRH